MNIKINLTRGFKIRFSIRKLLSLESGNVSGFSGSEVKIDLIL